jgi:hypothetical protein
VIAIPSEGLRVEMFWNPPDRSCDTHPGTGCDPTDVDLHLLHPTGTRWFSETDCYYGNCNASYAVLEWDRPGPADNPRLDQDDTEGYGPENINIDEPVIGHEYWVGVHYFADDGRWPGPSQVTVKIYCSTIDAAPVAEFGPVAIRMNDGGENRDFWRVAAVTWNGTRCTVRNLADASGRPNITTSGVVQGAR